MAVPVFAKDLTAGTLGGVAVTLVGHPFDTVKVRLQTQSTSAPTFNGPIDCIRKTLSWEGPRGLYRGVSSPLAGQMFFRASLFGTYGGTKRLLSQGPDGTQRELGLADFVLAGAVTGLTAAFFECPIDLFKSQMQVQIIKEQSLPGYRSPYSSMSDCVRQALRLNGIRGPYQGLTATMMRNIPANSSYFGSFEMIKETMAKHRGCKKQELALGDLFACGGLAGTLYWVAVFPLDCIKSAQQSDCLVRADRQFPTWWTTAQRLYADGGVRRFFRGYGVCLVRAVPANGAMLATVDMVNHYLLHV
eukprot:TRINITY_DN55747_c0_g1_i1.p1 TRINITY_DN55747_c0_g1~~TRINITY_DN55747_c0_g1_i1.p1  ORF type:complete len:303 (+),score=64.28 TRINITY_DN55747_c0_g1_i1:81-989(+)